MTGQALRAVLEAAFGRHQAGELDAAERQYREVLRRDPRHAEARHLLGLLHHQRGQPAEAEALIAEAIRHRPEAGYFENLAVIQKSRGAYERAVETCRAGLARGFSVRLATVLLETLLATGRYLEALAELDELDRREPASAVRLSDRAFCLLRLGRVEEAGSAAERALVLEGTNGNALAVLAEIATGRGDHGKAAALWRRAWEAHPGWTAARINLGLSLAQHNDGPGALEVLRSIPLPGDVELATKLLNGLSAAYRQEEENERAQDCLEAALSLLPGSAEFLSNLSELRRGKDAAYAQRLTDRALTINPASAEAYNNRGLALEEQDRLEEAAASLHRAIALQPHHREFLNNLASPLKWGGSFEAALTAQGRALAIDRCFAPARYGLGAMQLTLGNFEQGWRNYEWRLRSGQIVRPRPFQFRNWQGPPQSEGTLLVWSEQGLGDEIVYGSMLPDLVHHGVPAVVECDKRMVSIFSRAMPRLEFIARRDPPDERLQKPDVTAQVAMGSLAQWFRTRLDAFPKSGGYLTPRADLLDHWRRRLADLGDGPKIGFAWRSRRIDGLARRLHPPVLEWASVLRQRGVKFISLQYGETDADIRAIEERFGTRIHQFSDLDLFNDLEGILALSAALDMAITTGGTALCFPAAAGTPLWLLIPESDFWIFGTQAYPFFPSVRIYKHRRAMPWADAIGRIAADLDRYLDGWAGNR